MSLQFVMLSVFQGACDVRKNILMLVGDYVEDYE